jgi:NAD(P)-dependent dehydrogenase (short-subunit alcohol dehydrogenase family)
MAERVAVVTGVSKGLGAALAACLAERGFAVIGIGRAAPRSPSGAPLRLVEVDLANVASARRAADRLFGEIAARRADVVALINNAAVAGPTGTVDSLDVDAVDLSLAVNLRAPIAIAGAFVRAFAGDVGDRRLLNVSSGAAAHAIPGIGTYCIAKAGLEMLTQVVAAEHAEHGIVAVTLRPGVIDTEMQAFARSQSREALPSIDMFRGFHESGQLQSPDTTAAKIVDRLVIGRIESGRTYSYAEL